MYKNLCFEWNNEFYEWVKVQGFTQNHITHILTYYKKHFEGRTFQTPFELQKFIFAKEKGHKGHVISARAYLKFCEETSKEPPELIEKYRKILKVKQSRKIYYVPTNEDVANAYQLLKANKTLKLLFLVLATSGIRILEALNFLRTYDETKFTIHDSYVTYSVSNNRHTKNINNIYLPLFVYEQLEHINNTYAPINGNVREKGVPFSLKYLRKWHYNLMLYNQIPESVADFIQGRTSKSIGANHYLARSQQAEFWYAKVVEKFGEIMNTS